jgi:hypothetical protein
VPARGKIEGRRWHASLVAAGLRVCLAFQHQLRQREQWSFADFRAQGRMLSLLGISMGVVPVARRIRQPTPLEKASVPRAGSRAHGSPTTVSTPASNPP